MWPHMRERLLKGGFQFLRGRLPRNLGSHIVEVALKILSSPAVLALQCAFDDMSKVALGRHVGGPRL